MKPLRFSSIHQCVELPVSSLKTNICNILTHWWHNWMCSPLVVQVGSWKKRNSWKKTANCGNITGGSYIETPPILTALKRSIFNIVKKRDNFCFLYCIAAAIFSFVGRPHSPKIHKKNTERLSFNPKLMPMPLSAVPTFEKRNSCSINVYQLENSKLVSVYHSKNRKGRHKIDMLLWLENKNSHYCLMKIISTLIHFLCRSKSKKTKGQSHDSGETAFNR